MNNTLQHPITDEFLAREIERTIYEYSWTWEGEREQLIDTGDALIHVLDVPWFGNHGFAGRLVFEPASVEERLDTVLAQAEAGGRTFVWITGPSTRPTDLHERLIARGLEASILWDGLALRDLSQPFEHNPEGTVEPLSEANVVDYATICARFSPDISVYDERLAAARRLLQAGQRDAQVVLARIDGTPAGSAVMRMEPTGVAYLRNAFTLPEFRGRGLYLAMIAARLAMAREAGCRAAVVQAQTHTSSPILKKRGFEALCQLRGLVRPNAQPESQVASTG
jgi:GNAT superfamily N-acetyltransferase